eukprot:403368555
MAENAKEMRNDPPRYFNHMRYRTRVMVFIRMRWRRFAYLGLFVLAFNYLANFFGFVFARWERSARKYKKQYIAKKMPTVMGYQSAFDTLYQVQNLSQQSTDRLSEAFIKADRQLKNGFSRQLLINILSLGKLDSDSQKKILDESKATTLFGKLASPITMKEYLQILESKVEIDKKNGQSDELKFVDEFIRLLDKEVVDFDKNLDKMVKSL